MNSETVDKLLVTEGILTTLLMAGAGFFFSCTALLGQS